MEFRRRQNSTIGYEEHPRAGSTDDVEAMIALLHRMLGNVFTLKEFKCTWRAVVRYLVSHFTINNLIEETIRLKKRRLKQKCENIICTDVGLHLHL
jgi:hypothetical protein